MTDQDNPPPPDDPVLAAAWSQLADYISGQTTPAETIAFEQRLATDPAFAAFAAPVIALWQLPLPPLPPDPDTIDVAAAWERLERRLPPLPAPTATLSPSHPHQSDRPVVTPSVTHAIPRHRVRAWFARHPKLATGIAVAALLILGIQVDHHYLRPIFHYRAGTTVQHITLPDSSTADLAPGAYLGTSRSYTHGARTVYLFGQAHFQVVSNPARPFTVQALGVEAAVLGTTFDVASDTQPHVTVNVQSGKVFVTLLTPNGKRRPLGVLTAGQVQNMPALTQWFAREGYILAAAGVSLSEAAHIQAALLRAAATVVTPH
ncbi:MAG TPA: FecR domain-containing protein [Gemmatimonadaceae bacterium]|jgi:ferric-dicitrate binding protein FerR (iron transport regulator)|nr:FecR domain-containing protein [Gemmatimonadaceae bacterium]